MSDPAVRRLAADGRDPVALGVLADYIGFQLRLANAASFRAFTRRAGRPRLRPGWFTILSLVGDNPGITPVALRRASDRDKSTLTPLMRALHREGLIERHSIPGDRRSYGLSLTAEGGRALATLAVALAAHERVLDEIAGDRKPELMHLLRRFTAELDRD